MSPTQPNQPQSRTFHEEHNLSPAAPSVDAAAKAGYESVVGQQKTAKAAVAPMASNQEATEAQVQGAINNAIAVLKSSPLPFNREAARRIREALDAQTKSPGMETT